MRESYIELFGPEEQTMQICFFHFVIFCFASFLFIFASTKFNELLEHKMISANECQGGAMVA